MTDKMKPILFSGEMVRAILDGRKTQTRRVIEPRVLGRGLAGGFGIPGWYYDGGVVTDFAQIAEEHRVDYAPYSVGDILWVRETWSTPNDGEVIYYKADYPDGAKGFWYEKERINWCDFPLWKPSIHMPREAARIFLRVTGVRVERVQDITPVDACREGVLVELPEAMRREQAGLPREIPEAWATYSEDQLHNAARNAAIGAYMQQCDVMQQLVDGYHGLWDSLYAKRGFGWNVNPWVWVYDFEIDY